jgi:hypothetical protein
LPRHQSSRCAVSAAAVAAAAAAAAAVDINYVTTWPQLTHRNGRISVPACWCSGQLSWSACQPPAASHALACRSQHEAFCVLQRGAGGMLVAGAAAVTAILTIFPRPSHSRPSHPWYHQCFAALLVFAGRGGPGHCRA